MGAARVLMERAVALLPESERPLELELRLIEARFAGGELQWGMDATAELAARAERRGDAPGALRAWLNAAQYGLLAGGTGAGMRELGERGLEVFGETGDDVGLADSYCALAYSAHFLCQWTRQAEVFERMREHAARAGNLHLVEKATMLMGSGYVFGSVPVDEALAWFEANAEVVARRAPMLAQMGLLNAMIGDFERARRLCDESLQRSLELGQRLEAASSMGSTHVELIAGEAATAADLAVAGCRRLEELGERGWLSTLACHAAEALYLLGRDDDAWSFTDTAAAAGAEDDIITQMLLRQVRGKILARRGELAEAQRLLGEALALGRRHGHARCDGRRPIRPRECARGHGPGRRGGNRAPGG